MSRLQANVDKVSKEVVVKVKEIEEKLIAEAEGELATLTAKAKDKKLKEIAIQATVKALHELVEEGHKVVVDFGTLASKDKAERVNPARTMIHPTTKQEIQIPESVTPAKTVVTIEKPAEIVK